MSAKDPLKGADTPTVFRKDGCNRGTFVSSSTHLACNWEFIQEKASGLILEECRGYWGGGQTHPEITAKQAGPATIAVCTM